MKPCNAPLAVGLLAISVAQTISKQDGGTNIADNSASHDVQTFHAAPPALALCARIDPVHPLNQIKGFFCNPGMGVFARPPCSYQPMRPSNGTTHWQSARPRPPFPAGAQREPALPSFKLDRAEKADVGESPTRQAGHPMACFLWFPLAC